MLVQWWGAAAPDAELPDGLVPDDELPGVFAGDLAVDPLEVDVLVVWAAAGEVVVVPVLAVAAEIPRPRLSPAALAAIPPASRRCLSFMR